MAKRQEKKTLHALVAAAILAAYPGAALSAPEKVWLLYQNASYLPGGGTTVLTLSKSQMKLYSPSLTIFLQGPGHPASLYSEESKEYLQQPYEQWKKEFVGDNKANGSRVMVKGKKTDKVAGLKVEEWQSWSIDPRFPKRLRRIYWLTNDIPVGNGVRDAIRGLTGLAPGEGLPVRILDFAKTGRKEMLLLDTLKVSQAPATPGTFKRPPGFKRAESAMALLMHSSKDDSFSDLYGETSVNPH